MSKVYDGIMGLAVGDALGVPVEFRQRGSYSLTDMVGHGTHNQPKGTWSDDTSMTLATMWSIWSKGGEVILEDIMKMFWEWAYNAAFTAGGVVFDIGGTTSAAIRRYAAGFPVAQCGATELHSCGNGSLMRILPLAFISAPAETVEAVGGLTHNHEICHAACKIYVEIARDLIAGVNLRDAIMKHHAFRIQEIPFMDRDEVKSTGYVVDTLEAALWCLYHTSSYGSAVLAAVNLGSDTDTVGAVCGGLAGLAYGADSIPESWVQAIRNRVTIAELCNRFERVTL